MKTKPLAGSYIKFVDGRTGQEAPVGIAPPTSTPLTADEARDIAPGLPPGRPLFGRRKEDGAGVDTRFLRRSQTPPASRVDPMLPGKEVADRRLAIAYALIELLRYTPEDIRSVCKDLSDIGQAVAGPEIYALGSEACWSEPVVYGNPASLAERHLVDHGNFADTQHGVTRAAAPSPSPTPKPRARKPLATRGPDGKFRMRGTGASGRRRGVSRRR